MSSGTTDVHSRFIHALRTQANHHKPGRRSTNALPCPYPGHQGRVFQNIEQLLSHARAEHSSQFNGLASPQARAKLVRDSKNSDRNTEASAGDESARLSSPDIASLSLGPGQGPQPLSSSGKKRPADSDIHARKEKVASRLEIADEDYSRNIPYTIKTVKNRSRPQDHHSYKSKHGVKATTSPRRSATEPCNDSPVEIGTSQVRLESPNEEYRTMKSQSAPAQSHTPGVIELQKKDNRFPGLLLQPDSRPISQEQLASEVKSIYAGLTMVETKCIHVDRAQTAVPQDANTKLAPDHWQALIALHRTLLYEHHDFFLASQHPAASPALRRLASKYTMPARMWKYGIHSFLEILRQKLPHSLDYMLAFIYLAYQMMALLYETVPAFEDTWIECLGDLGRYRMAIEDEDVRDRETWAGVARSWYSKAADKNPTIGRLYHHLAILARPNALQQLYYYTTSLNCVEPFPSARESIMTLFKPLIQEDQPTHVAGLSVETNFTKAHAFLFTVFAQPGFDEASRGFLDSLDNHIGRVTAKWKEQGVYIAVSNITAWFNYGDDLHILRQLFLLRTSQARSFGSKDKKQPPSVSTDLPKPTDPKIIEDQIQDQVEALSADSTFVKAKALTHDTFTVALCRIGDRNVLPHVHVILSFLTTLATIPYVSHFIDQTPWVELVSFLNTLIKTETQKNNNLDINTLISQSIFPKENDFEERDELPLPEDYLIRGLVWAQEYLPADWLARERDEEERYLELASTAKNRTERVLRLGYRLSTIGHWISYDQDTCMFAVKA